MNTNNEITDAGKYKRGDHFGGTTLVGVEATILLRRHHDQVDLRLGGRGERSGFGRFWRWHERRELVGHIASVRPDGLLPQALPGLMCGYMEELPKIIAVIGPTASGKTALGVRLAEEFGGAIVSADAKQVYRGMDIGTAKERGLFVPQYLIDFKQPGEPVAVGEYQSLAYAKIDELLAANTLPILVGGSGLYAESVLEGYIFGGKGSKLKNLRYQSLKLGIAVERGELRRRVAARTHSWLEQGLLEEIGRLLSEGVSAEWLKSCGMEYRYFTAYQLGEISLDEAVRLTDGSQGQFIKRQYTWWRRHSNVQWVTCDTDIIQLVNNFLS
jgi:tRNA A37 N6-isopentenylltransferase MiaA